MALFSRDGRQIYVAQARGLLCVLDRASRQFLDALRVRAGVPSPQPAAREAPQDCQSMLV